MKYIFTVLNTLMDNPEEPLGYFSTNRKAYEFMKEWIDTSELYVNSDLVKKIGECEPIKSNFKNDYEEYNEYFNIMRFELDNF